MDSVQRLDTDMGIQEYGLRANLKTESLIDLLVQIQ